MLFNNVGSPVSLRKLLFAYTCYQTNYRSRGMNDVTGSVRVYLLQWATQCMRFCQNMLCVLMSKKHSHAPPNDVSVDGRHMII